MGGGTGEPLLEKLDALGEELYLLLGQGGPPLKLLELFLRTRRRHVAEVVVVVLLLLVYKQIYIYVRLLAAGCSGRYICRYVVCSAAARPLYHHHTSQQKRRNEIGRKMVC
jgi:hypothetical protein